MTFSSTLARVRWFNLGVLALTPTFAIYGAFTTKLTLNTAILSAILYLITMLGQLLNAATSKIFVADLLI